jgi:hypothetical protein
VPTLRDTGFGTQMRLIERILGAGQTPIMVDSRELLTDPSSVLSQLCARLGLPFEESMLSWPAGAKPEDGVWGDHWYSSVRASTGFAPYRPKTAPFPPALDDIYAQCEPLYRDLLEFAIRA